jgi:hypothetical protein
MIVSIPACSAQTKNDSKQDIPDSFVTPQPGVSETQEPLMSGFEYISTRTLVDNLRKEFTAGRPTVNSEPLWNLPIDHTFSFDLEFEPRSVLAASEMFSVYIDSALKERIPPNVEIVLHEDDPSIPKGHSRVYLRPDMFPAGRVHGAYYSIDIGNFEEIRLEESGNRFLHEADENEIWGFLKHYYLVQRVDLRTGHTLPESVVTIFTLENQLEAPQSEFFVTQDGRGGFRWTPVDGADYYLIVRIPSDITFYSVMNPIMKVTETHWTHPGSDWGLKNWAFRDVYADDNFSVIAVNKQTHSALGTLHNGNDIRSILAYTWNWFEDPLDAGDIDGILHFFLPNIGLLPTHRPIVMLNDITVHRSIIYDFDHAELKHFPFAFWQEGPDGEQVDYWESFDNIHIPFTIEGAGFAGVMVADASPDTYAADLAAMRQQIEEAAPRGGGTRVITLAEHPVRAASEPPSEEDTSDEIQFYADDSDKILFRADDKVYANSVLSAFLARNMMVAVDFIDLRYFPESADWEYLTDAFFEALYQNPLILHVDSIARIPGENVLSVYYRESAETIFEQQEALRHIVPEIVADNITENMTDLEKSMALNRFLVEWAEYDWDALEDAEKNNFMTVDSRFNDSFNAYGILLNRVGVCAGYAEAYKLLADEAGLNSIVVTGYLEGTLPHAWNRVNIDGHWNTLDVTNNANKSLPNVFLHLSDSMAKSVLVENSRFVLNDYLDIYKSTDKNSEYFYITGRFFEISAIAEELAREIQENGSATLRTDYTLTDGQFNMIVKDVIRRLGITDINASHRLGVIRMA